MATRDSLSEVIELASTLRAKHSSRITKSAEAILSKLLLHADLLVDQQVIEQNGLVAALDEVRGQLCGWRGMTAIGG